MPARIERDSRSHVHDDRDRAKPDPAPQRWRAAVSDKRIKTRKRVLKSGFIVISEKAPKLECTVRNLSDTGASLQVSTTIGIPKKFDVIIDGGRQRCRAAWRTDTKIGVVFE